MALSASVSTSSSSSSKSSSSQMWESRGVLATSRGSRIISFLKGVKVVMRRLVLVVQGVEQEAGGFVIDLLGEEQAHDLHESDLDGVGVFEDRKDEGGNAATGAVGAEADAFVLKAFVEKTETVAA